MLQPQRANRTPVTSYDSDEDDALPEGDPLDRWILWEVNESEHYVTTVGGPLAWWAEKQKVRPDYFELAQMAFDYLSTPGAFIAAHLSRRSESHYLHMVHSYFRGLRKNVPTRSSLCQLSADS